MWVSVTERGETGIDAAQHGWGGKRRAALSQVLAHATHSAMLVQGCMSCGGLLHEDTNWTAYRGARESDVPWQIDGVSGHRGPQKGCEVKSR